MTTIESLKKTLTPKNRVTIAEFLRRVRRLHKAQEARIRRELGNPPDIRNISAETWKELRKEEEAALLILILGAATPMLLYQAEHILGRVDRDVSAALQRRLAALARQRARWASGRIIGTSRRRARRGSDDIYDGRRNELVAQNEFVAGQSIAVSATVDIAIRLGLPVEMIWLLGPCKHCEVCPMLHKTPRSFWGGWTAGPPLHPNCCCSVTAVFGTPRELRRKGLLEQNPPASQVLRALQKLDPKKFG